MRAATVVADVGLSARLCAEVRRICSHGALFYDGHAPSVAVLMRSDHRDPQLILIDEDRLGAQRIGGLARLHDVRYGAHFRAWR